MFKFHTMVVAIFMALTLSSCGSEQNVQQGPAYSADIPKGQLPHSIRPTHYQIDLKIIPDNSDFSGQVAIDLTFDVTTDFMWLHGQDLTVSKAELTLEDGKTIPVTYAQVDPTGIAKLSFPAKVGPGKAQLKITYKGKVSDALQGIYRVKDGDYNYTYTQFEAIDARRAFPGFDEPGFKVPFDVSLTVPTGLEGLGNTPEISRTDLGDGFTKMTFATTKPLPSYLVAFAVGPFDVVEWQDMPKTAVRDHTVPLRGIATKGKGGKLTYALEHSAEILGALEDYFQIPYPYAKLDILAVPDFAYGAMENAGAITYREQLLLLDENSSLGLKKRYMGVHAHELAHQWFGNLVTPVWWNDIWLNEAFATWMSQTALDNILPEYKFRQGLLRGSLGAMRGDSLVSARQIRQPILSNDDIVTAFDGITYQKGGGVLAMIESFMGPEEFRAGIHNYMTRYAFENATSNDFITAIGEKSTKVPMEQVRAAFNSFLEQPGIPYLDIRSAYEGGNTVLTIAQSRYFPLGSSGDTDKSWIVPACFGYAIDGKAHKYCTLLDQKKMTVTLPDKGKLDYLMPNLNGAGYYRYALDGAGWSALFSHQNDLSAESMLSLTNSFTAAMDAGKLDFAAFVEVAPSIIASPSYRVVTTPMTPLTFMYDKVATTAAEKAKLSALSVKLYGPKLSAIGFEAKADDNGEVTNLRRALVGHLAFVGKDKALRAKLTDMAKRYVGYGSDGQMHGDRVDSNLISRALIVGVEDLGTDFGRHLLDLYLKSTDGTVRGRLLQAASSTLDAGFSAEVRDLVLSDKMRANEVNVVLGTQMFSDDLRDGAWVWFQANFDGVKARIPGFSQSRITGFASDFCSLEKRDEVKAFFTPRVKTIAGGSRSLAQTLETIELCVAKVKFHKPKLVEFLGK
ncbi:MAG: M1 family metallopeptidase [Alphaproteobacteria bacterium]|nr:M1 family metallopeptidase [Alphaproteobacteria bacterium]